MASFPRTVIPFEVSALEMPGPLIAKAQSGRVNLRGTQQIGRTWTEHYLINVRSVAGRGLLAAVDNFYRNGTIFTIDHRDHLTPLGAGGGSPLINQSPQLVTSPENFGAWTPILTPTTLTSGQADPYGGTGAYVFTDDDGAQAEGYLLAVAFTGDAQKAVAIFGRAGTLATVIYKVRDATAAADRLRMDVTWTAGVPSVNPITGTAPWAIESFGGGWYRFLFLTTAVTAANANQVQVLGSTAGTGTAFIFGYNAWNNAAPSGYIGPSNLTATGSNLYIDGATASVSNWLRAGDLVGVGGLAPAYEVTADTPSQAGGYVVLPVNPPIFQGGAPADNAVVTITGVTMNACILEPPSYPSTSGIGADWGELQVRFSESL